MKYEKMVWSWSRSVFTASIIVPCAAPAEVKKKLTATRKSVRRKISRFTLKKEAMAEWVITPFILKWRCNLGRYCVRKNTTAASIPDHCATNVPIATPSIFMPAKSTKAKLTAMFTTFCMMEINMGMRVFCMPMNHPMKPYSPNIAGAPQMQTLK